jgi:phage gp36-like protein
MAYASAAELRAQYLTDDVDEFSHLSDAVLGRNMERASATIDRYCAQQAEGEAVMAMLKPLCLTIARAYAHDDQALTQI